MNRLVLFLAIISLTEINAQNLKNINDTDLFADSISRRSNLFSREASYIGDFAGNLSGGKNKGAVYLGIVNIKIGFNTKEIGLWSGGEFFLNGASTHGSRPSQKLFGDFQGASNIEAGNHTFLHELWYKHIFGSSEITIGLQDLNVEFVTSEFACTFINSSFGIPSLISDNIPAPIFPLTALGLMCKFRLNDLLVFRTAVYDGMPESFEQNQYNTSWKLRDINGYLLFSEVEFSTEWNNLPGTYKIGGYYHSNLNQLNEENRLVETVFRRNYGLYLLADQAVWQNSNNEGLGLFAQFAVSPSNINRHNYYIGGGLNYRGLFDNNGDDAFGLAFANAGFKNITIKDETTIELFYKAAVTEKLFIQPDIQYIINPACAEYNYDNTLAAFIRFGINF